MDKISDVDFAVNSFVLKSKRHSYCFDRCFSTFDQTVSDTQSDCLSNHYLIIENCVKVYEEGVNLMRSKWGDYLLMIYS